MGYVGEEIFKMELVLARQSVMIKCSIQSSILLGNYEFYYAAGLLCRLCGAIPGQAFQPAQLYDFIQPLLESYTPQNKEDAYLVKLLKGYDDISDECDAQMAELMQMGLKEDNLWAVTGAGG